MTSAGGRASLTPSRMWPGPSRHALAMARMSFKSSALSFLSACTNRYWACLKSKSVPSLRKRSASRSVQADEKDKAELLKDILAMANAWREGPGRILLGVKDARPHPAEVIGLNEHLDDAKLQQFVGSKIRPKLTFRYEECLYEGRAVGIISIPKQARPLYLQHPYGPLKSNVVYVRAAVQQMKPNPRKLQRWWPRTLAEATLSLTYWSRTLEMCSWKPHLSAGLSPPSGCRTMSCQEVVTTRSGLHQSRCTAPTTATGESW